MSDQVKKDYPICAILIDCNNGKPYGSQIFQYDTMEEAIKGCEEKLKKFAAGGSYIGDYFEIYNRVAEVGSELVTSVTHFSVGTHLTTEEHKVIKEAVEKAVKEKPDYMDFADNKGPEGQTSPLAPLPNNLLSAQDLTPTSAAAPASDAVNASTDAGDEYETISIKSPGNHPSFWNLRAGVHYTDLHIRLIDNSRSISFWPAHYPAEGIFEKEDTNRKPDGTHNGFNLYFKVKKGSVGNEEQQTGTASQETASPSDASTSQSGIGGGGSAGPDYTQKAAAPAWDYFRW